MKSYFEGRRDLFEGLEAGRLERTINMAFDIMSLFDDDKFVSPGSIGGKIKKFREMRGWSQKELGIRCGFSPSTADVRIAQYEKNKKIPREKALKEIST